MQFYLERIRKFYEELPSHLHQIQQRVNRPLTFTEKLLYLHAKTEHVNSTLSLEASSNGYIFDHVAMHDAVAQIVMLQFVSCGKRASAVSTSVHCDRLIVAENGAKSDLIHAYEESEEIFNFLQSASEKIGCDFWKPGSGMMIHQLFESYTFPGGMLFGTESHISYLGGLGVLAFDGSGVEALDAMISLPFDLEIPRVIGVYLSGSLQGWASPKDVGLKVLSLLVGKEATGTIIEYFGPGAETLSATGKATICSMSSQVGAISSLFPYDYSMLEFLNATNRRDVGEFAEQIKSHLRADTAVLEAPENYYHHFLKIHLSDLQPSITGPHVIDRPHALVEFQHLLHQYGYPEKLSLGLIGSCTNSSYEDLKKVAVLARQALKHGLKVKAPLLISPGSEKILDALKQEGLFNVLEDVGATFLSNACGPCIGQWKRLDVAFGEKNSILTSFNDSAPGHCDANPGTYMFVSSPEVVMAAALAGTLNFNPGIDALMNAQGLPVRLDIPLKSAVPENGFDIHSLGCVSAIEEASSFQVSIDPASERLQEFEPFKPSLEKAFLDLRLLVKADGKCSSEHISPLGKWMKFRGHLENISNNLFSLVPNSFRDEIGRGKNLLNNCIEPFAKVARDYKKEDIGWIVVGADNYGEGPIREHAALGVRYLGGKAVIAKSFSAAHEQNLKKQGVLVLSFTGAEDGFKIREDDLIDLLGISNLAVGSTLELLLKHADGTTDRVPLNHSYTEQQLSWFKAGSLLNTA